MLLSLAGSTLASVYIAHEACKAHRLQIEAIEDSCRLNVQRALLLGIQLPKEEIHKLLEEKAKELSNIKGKSITDRGGLHFIAGDFQEDGGKIRCGGKAVALMEYASSFGCGVELWRVWKGDKMHYYPVITHHGEHWILEPQNDSPLSLLTGDHEAQIKEIYCSAWSARERFSVESADDLMAQDSHHFAQAERYP